MPVNNAANTDQINLKQEKNNVKDIGNFVHKKNI